MTFTESMSRSSPWLPAVLAVIAGAANWEFAREIAERREPWDHQLYWQVGYPTLLLAAFAFGMRWRDRPWRWGVLLMGGQAAWALAAAILYDGIPTLFPLGFLVFAALTVPCVLAAYAGKWLGEKLMADWE